MHDLKQRLGQLEQLVSDLLAEAKRQGASAAEAGVSSDAGLSVNVRMGEPETIEYTRDNGLGVTVYFGQRKGSASTSDLSPEAVTGDGTGRLQLCPVYLGRRLLRTGAGGADGQGDPGSGSLPPLGPGSRCGHRQGAGLRGGGPGAGPAHREFRRGQSEQPQWIAGVWE